MAVLGKYHNIPCEIAIAKFCLRKLKIVDHFHSFICPTYIPKCDFQTIVYTSQNIHGIPLHDPSYQELDIFDDLSKNYDLLLERIFKFLGCERSKKLHNPIIHDNNKISLIDFSNVLLIAHAPHAEICSFTFLTQESSSYKELKFPKVHDIKDFVTSYEKGNVYFEPNQPTSSVSVNRDSSVKVLSSRKLNDLLRQLCSNACDKKCHFHAQTLKIFHCALSDVFGIAHALSCTIASQYKNIQVTNETDVKTTVDIKQQGREQDELSSQNSFPNEGEKNDISEMKKCTVAPTMMESIDPKLYQQIEEEWTCGETIEYFYN